MHTHIYEAWHMDMGMEPWTWHARHLHTCAWVAPPGRTLMCLYKYRTFSSCESECETTSSRRSRHARARADPTRDAQPHSSHDTRPLTAGGGIARPTRVNVYLVSALSRRDTSSSLYTLRLTTVYTGTRAPETVALEGLRRTDLSFTPLKSLCRSAARCARPSAHPSVSLPGYLRTCHVCALRSAAQRPRHSPPPPPPLDAHRSDCRPVWRRCRR